MAEIGLAQHILAGNLTLPFLLVLNVTFLVRFGMRMLEGRIFKKVNQ